MTDENEGQQNGFHEDGATEVVQSMTVREGPKTPAVNAQPGHSDYMTEKGKGGQMNNALPLIESKPEPEHWLMNTILSPSERSDVLISMLGWGIVMGHTVRPDDITWKFIVMKPAEDGRAREDYKYAITHQQQNRQRGRFDSFMDMMEGGSGGAGGGNSPAPSNMER